MSRFREEISTAVYECKGFAMKTSAQQVSTLKEDLSALIRQKERECLKRGNIDDLVDYFKYESDSQA